MWKFLGQGSNPCHSGDPSRSVDYTGSVTHLSHKGTPWIEFEEEMEFRLQGLGRKAEWRGHFSLKRLGLGAKFPVAQTQSACPMNRFQFVEIIWHVQIYLHVVLWARGGSSSFRIDMRLGTGPASVFLGHGSIFIFRRGSQLGMIKHPTPVSHSGLEMYCLLVSYFCFGWWVFLEMGDSTGQGVSTLGRMSQNSRGFILEPLLLMLFERLSSPFHSVEAYSTGNFPGSHPLGPFWDFVFVISTCILCCQSDLLKLCSSTIFMVILHCTILGL